MYKQNVCYFTGVDDTLAKHIAYLFIRDPIVLYQEYLKQDDEKDTDHFEVGDVIDAILVFQNAQIETENI